MTRPTAEVRTTDLGEALDYLQGLVTILEDFDLERRGVDGKDELPARLRTVDNYTHVWEPLRYQVKAGQGWRTVAENVADLRHRLMSGYTDAAL